METEKYSRENDVALNPGVIYISTYDRESETLRMELFGIFCLDIPDAEIFFKWKSYSH